MTHELYPPFRGRRDKPGDDGEQNRYHPRREGNHRMSDNLMTSRRFAPLFWCQFFSAFNDNFLKNALVFLILFAPGVTNREALITITAGVFIGPFFFLSGLG